MMFAGGGLFLSMVVTTMWISGDVTRMREETKAKDQAACMTIDTPQPGAAVADDSFSAAPAPADPSCAPSIDGVTGTGAAQEQIDPVTGLPIAAASQGEVPAGFDDADPGPSLDPDSGSYVEPAATGGGTGGF